MNKRVLLAGSAVLCIASAFGWGQKGHDVTAAIAERHLTPTTQAAISELLDGKSIVYWANWLDNASHTPEYAYSKTWHYKNIDADQEYETAPSLESGTIVTALDEQIPMLSDPQLSKEEKALALKIVVHLVGDIHQPMHMGHASDLGGNRRTIKVFNKNSNLHSAWDSAVPDSGHKWSYSEWVDQIDRADDESIEEYIYGTPYSWGEETYIICRSIYAETPEDYNISYDYIANWTPTIEEQFLKGGLRLANVLNTAFDPEYTGTLPNNK